MTRRATLLTTVFLTLFSQAALGKAVYFCEMTQNIDVKKHTLKPWKVERFKFSVSPEEVAFGTSAPPPFTEKKLAVRIYEKEGQIFNAAGYFNLLNFKDGDFHYVESHFSEVVLVTAKCDKF